MGPDRTSRTPGLEAVWSVLEGTPTEASAAPPEGATLSAPEAWSVAVFGEGGELRHADPRFAAWLGEPSTRAACDGLLRRARSGEVRFGLVPTESGGVIPMCAAPAAAARRWASDAAAALTEPGAATALVAFAPSRSPDLVRRATEAFGLTPMEGRLVAALMEAPTLELAAQELGIGRDTAKAALSAAMRKAGVQRSSQLIARIIDLICGAIEVSQAEAPALAELTEAEGRVAAILAQGETAEATAERLGLSVHTVKSHRKTILAKLGLARTRDLSRVMAELSQLRQLVSRREVRLEEARPEDGRLRVITAADGRRVAMFDYGPASGHPIAIGHGLATGRRLPPALVRGLQARGYRPLAPQRPGFGLTDPAVGDYVTEAADDLAAILDSLRAPKLSLVMREGGAPVGIAFGARHSGRLARGVLLNPRPPKDKPLTPRTLGGGISRRLLHNPRLIAPFFEMLRRHTSTALLHAIIHQVYEAQEIDRLWASKPEVLAHLVRDVQGLVARTSAGVVAEHLVYSEGWRPAPGGLDGRWTVIYSDSLWNEPDLASWRAVCADIAALEGAGQLAHFTHAEALVELIGPRPLA